MPLDQKGFNNLINLAIEAKKAYLLYQLNEKDIDDFLSKQDKIRDKYKEEYRISRNIKALESNDPSEISQINSDKEIKLTVSSKKSISYQEGDKVYRCDDITNKMAEKEKETQCLYEKNMDIVKIMNNENKAFKALKDAYYAEFNLHSIQKEDIFYEEYVDAVKNKSVFIIINEFRRALECLYKEKAVSLSKESEKQEFSDWKVSYDDKTHIEKSKNEIEALEKEIEALEKEIIEPEETSKEKSEVEEFHSINAIMKKESEIYSEGDKQNILTELKTLAREGKKEQFKDLALKNKTVLNKHNPNTSNNYFNKMANFFSGTDYETTPSWRTVIKLANQLEVKLDNNQDKEENRDKQEKVDPLYPSLK